MKEQQKEIKDKMNELEQLKANQKKVRAVVAVVVS